MLARETLERCTHKAGSLLVNLPSVVHEHGRISNLYKKSLKHKLENKHTKYIFSLSKEELRGSSGLCSLSIGTFMTFVLLAGSAYALLQIIRHEKEMTDRFAFSVSLALTIIKSVIPTLVQQIIAFEGWMDPEQIMQQTLLRVYLLKMSNLVRNFMPYLI